MKYPFRGSERLTRGATVAALLGVLGTAGCTAGKDPSKTEIVLPSGRTIVPQDVQQCEPGAEQSYFTVIRSGLPEYLGPLLARDPDVWRVMKAPLEQNLRLDAFRDEFRLSTTVYYYGDGIEQKAAAEYRAAQLLAVSSSVIGVPPGAPPTGEPVSQAKRAPLSVNHDLPVIDVWRRTICPA